MSTRQNSKKMKLTRLLTGIILLVLSFGLGYAGDTGGAVHNFKDWATSMIDFFEQIKAFVQIVATVVGMWFVYSALQLFRKHHTTQGAQGEHVKHGAGHLLLGIFLMCLVPGIQMLQKTLSTNMGDQKSEQTFTVDSDIFNKT
ncbi:hypothetical protein [Facilibium subflavum]|uniref:hypothetical protein n=1 Tax=Facilibium subflavum TaxID=2219058 RepID=UPI001F1D767E|nr:hypothetical protein [Facilibium subflavum]